MDNFDDVLEGSETDSSSDESNSLYAEIMLLDSIDDADEHLFLEIIHGAIEYNSQLFSWVLNVFRYLSAKGSGTKHPLGMAVKSGAIRLAEEGFHLLDLSLKSVSILRLLSLREDLYLLDFFLGDDQYAVSPENLQDCLELTIEKILSFSKEIGTYSQEFNAVPYEDRLQLQKERDYSYQSQIDHLGDIALLFLKKDAQIDREIVLEIMRASWRCKEKRIFSDILVSCPFNVQDFSQEEYNDALRSALYFPTGDLFCLLLEKAEQVNRFFTSLPDFICSCSSAQVSLIIQSISGHIRHAAKSIEKIKDSVLFIRETWINGLRMKPLHRMLKAIFGDLSFGAWHTNMANFLLTSEKGQVFLHNVRDAKIHALDDMMRNPYTKDGVRYAIHHYPQIVKICLARGEGGFLKIDEENAISLSSGKRKKRPPSTSLRSLREKKGGCFK